jgi:HlyD family secretion protein
MRISQGASVEIRGLEGAKSFKGKVNRVSRAGFLKMSALGVEEERTEVYIEIGSPLQQLLQHLGEGFHVEVAILLLRKEQALKVPLGALFKVEDRWATYVIKENRAALRFLDISEKNEAEAVVISGLLEGEEVILFPSDLISDHTVVQ